MSRFAKITLCAQAAVAALLILSGVFYGIRCLIAGNLFCALCFAMAAAVIYNFLFPAALKYRYRCKTLN